MGTCIFGAAQEYGCLNFCLSYMLLLALTKTRKKSFFSLTLFCELLEFRWIWFPGNFKESAVNLKFKPHYHLAYKTHCSELDKPSSHCFVRKILLGRNEISLGVMLNCIFIPNKTQLVFLFVLPALAYVKLPLSSVRSLVSPLGSSAPAAYSSIALMEHNRASVLHGSCQPIKHKLNSLSSI